MRKNPYFLNILLTIVLGLWLLGAVLVRTFAPNVIIPRLDGLHLIGLSLLTLVLEHYLAPKASRCYVAVPVFSAAAFALLPLAACLVTPMAALKLALLGGVVFTACTWVFATITDRLSTGPAAKLAPAISALGLFLAAQAFMGMF